MERRRYLVWMNSRWASLYFKYEHIIGQHSPYWQRGIECRLGWYDLVSEALEALDKLGNVEVHQIKEKFGGMRLYLGSAAWPAWAIASKAEAMSFHICENCGTKESYKNKNQDTYTKASNYWILTLCGYCRLHKDMGWI